MYKRQEVLCVAVVPLPGATLTEKSVVEHCAANLAKFKVPARVFVRRHDQVLPRNGTGKILKRVLREEYAKESTKVSLA